MKIKKQLSFYITIAVILSVLYIIFSIQPIGKEFQFTPEWKIDVSNPTIKENKNNSSVNYFKLSQTAGYFTSDGEVTNFITFPYKASISDYYYTSYNSNNTSTDFFTPDGTKKGTITQSGFPMIVEDRIFVFLPGGSSFVKCKEDGSKDWEYDSTCPITAFYSAKNALVAGYADGTIVHFTNEGDIIQNFQPGGSDYPVILAAALSNDGSYIASVSGQNRQRFVLAKKEGAQTKIVFHEYFPTNTKVQQIVKFSNDDRLCFYTCKNSAGIVDIKKKKSTHIPINGSAISLKESKDCFFLLTKKQKEYSVYIIEKFTSFTGCFQFQADAAFIETDEENLYIGKNSTISKIKISKE